MIFCFTDISLKQKMPVWKFIKNHLLHPNLTTKKQTQNINSSVLFLGDSTVRQSANGFI